MSQLIRRLPDRRCRYDLRPGCLLSVSVMADALAKFAWRGRGIFGVLAVIVLAQLFWILPALLIVVPERPGERFVLCPLVRQLARLRIRHRITLGESDPYPTSTRRLCQDGWPGHLGHLATSGFPVCAARSRLHRVLHARRDPAVSLGINKSTRYGQCYHSLSTNFEPRRTNRNDDKLLARRRIALNWDFPVHETTHTAPGPQPNY